jgi:RHS repeat-associated protein
VPRALADGATSASDGQQTALASEAGTVLGMGESFTPQLSTGLVSFGVPLRLPAARGGAQPRLDLSYSSAGGFGIAGQGWALGSSAISRQTDRGAPKYDDGAAYQEDRFVFGGMELVPICTAQAGGCLGASLQPTEVLPTWATGWRYFRARVEGGFLRFFWSADHRTWRVQSKDGGNFEFGVPLDGSGYTGALEANPDRPAEIYRWCLVRQYDSEGGVNATSTPQPVNAIVYRYMADHGATYLSEIYDTSPIADPTSKNLSQYAHHIHLNYEARPDIVISYRTGWRIEYALRLSGVDVASKPFSGSPTAPRVVARRYHFQYDPSSHTSLLVSTQLEGRCSVPATEAASELLPSTACPTLPATRFEYQRVDGTGDALTDSQGKQFEEFSETVKSLANSPPRSLDDPLTALMDVNGDGLPDVVVTKPSSFNGAAGVYFNGTDPSGAAGFANATRLPVIPVGSVDANVLLFNNPVVSVLDVNGQGVADIVHMPKAKNYAVFSPSLEGSGWVLHGRAVTNRANQDVKIDFTNDARNVRTMDVNGDGLVDVVYSSPTEVQTFFSLGRYPNGADQFGHGSRTGTATATLSNDPVTACAPWSASPARFSDSDVKIADMNGDGLPDIVRMRPGEVLYWPGRGNGFWGTGARDDCSGGSFAVDRHVTMFSAPQFGIADPGALFLGDVNGDGLADLVEVRTDAVDLYLNDSGLGWTTRHTIEHTPARSNGSSYARITDIDGSGSADVLWGHGYEYKYIDLTGGVVPYLLRKIRNGLGSTTELEYASSASLMRGAAKSGSPWAEPLAPAVTPVLVRSTVRDNLEKIQRPAGAYVKEYAYRDPVYEGRQRAFSGFRDVTVTTLGDDNSPSSYEHTIFLLGECPKDSNGTSADVCSPSTLWQDNWNEALKGLPVVTEVGGDDNVMLSIRHTQYELRQLYVGLDGRRVIVPYPIQEDGYLFDPTQTNGEGGGEIYDDVVFNLTGISPSPRQREVELGGRPHTAHIHSEATYDNFGNVRVSTKSGCVSGCETMEDDEAIVTHSDFSLPPGDASGWLWRETYSYVAGTQHTEHRNETTNSYNAQGKVTQQTAVLSGSLRLDRFHAQGLEIAGDPAAASGGIDSAATITLEQNTYDSTTGQLTVKKGPNGRNLGQEFDPLYGQLLTTAHVYVGVPDANGRGSTDLTTSFQYDRGLEVVTDSTGPRGQPSHFTFDGLGRRTASTFADPSNPGTLATAATEQIIYALPADASVAPYWSTTVLTADGANPDVSSYHSVQTYRDGLGRTLLSLSQADPSEGDGGDYVASGFTLYDAKGAPSRVYDPFFVSGPADLGGVPTSSFRSTEYDPFGRATHTYGLDGTLSSQTIYHSLSRDICDAADVGPGPREGTCATIHFDGHGRGTERIERVHVAGGGIEERWTINELLPTGEVVRVTQSTANQPDVVRWMKYDTLGRLVLNAEPNTSTAFNPDPTAPPANDFHALRYAYDDAGDLVGTSDARGCGSNFFYDAGGRLVAEDRSPCIDTQPEHTAPNLTTGDGTEAFYRYDSADPETAAAVDASGQALNVDTSLLLGRLVSVSSLGSKSIIRYDGLGRQTGTGVRMANPGTPATALGSRYAPRWYVTTATVDAMDRISTRTTGASVSALFGSDGASQVAYTYSKRGALIGVGGSYGTLAGGSNAASAMLYDADGKPAIVTLGDAAGTERAYVYDQRRRLGSLTTMRLTAPTLWTNPPAGSGYTPPPPGAAPTQQLVLEDYQYHYDEVDNITQIEDFRPDADWPATAKPMTRGFQYDDLYRLIGTTYSRANGGTTDTWKSAYDAEETSGSRQPQPSPHVAFTTGPTAQAYAYDYLGNFSQTTDDQAAFWDRSLGDVTTGTPTSGPHQIRSASNRSLAASSTRKGDLSASYDAAGNLQRLIVRRDGACVPSTASCWQRFDYDWDEVGELVRARRWDLSVAERSTFASTAVDPPTRTPDADLRYGYDANGVRVLKTAVDAASVQRHTLYIFPTLEIRSTSYSETDYVVDATTTQVRLPAGPATARVLQLSTPDVTTNSLHVFLEFADQVGSTSVVVDQGTGELVESITRFSYGATEADYRPDRFLNYREPFGFGGKEEDIEVGLAYFGARYYSPFLGIWTSADPASIHSLTSEANPYAYVHGSPVMRTDPDGRFIEELLAGAAISMVINIVSQVAQHHTTHIDWGLHGVLGAGIVGGVTGVVAGAVSGAVTDMALSDGSGTVATNLAAGAVGGGAAGASAYVMSSMLNGTGMSWSGLGKSMAVGGAIGLAYGALKSLGEMDDKPSGSIGSSGEAAKAAQGQRLAAAQAEGDIPDRPPETTIDGVVRPDEPLAHANIRREIQRAYDESNPGSGWSPSRFEQGGWIVKRGSGFAVIRWPQGISNERIFLPPEPDGEIIVQDFHIHPNWDSPIHGASGDDVHVFRRNEIEQLIVDRDGVYRLTSPHFQEFLGPLNNLATSHGSSMWIWTSVGVGATAGAGIGAYCVIHGC